MQLEPDNNLIAEMDRLISDIDDEIKQTTQAVVSLKNNSGVRLDELRAEHEALERNHQQLNDRFTHLESEQRDLKCTLLKYEYFIRKMIEKIQDLRNSISDIRQQIGEQSAVTVAAVSVAKPEEAIEEPVAVAEPEEAIEAPVAIAEPEEAIEEPVVVAELEEAIEEPVTIAEPEEAIEEPVAVAELEEAVEEPVAVAELEEAVKEPVAVTDLEAIEDPITTDELDSIEDIDLTEDSCILEAIDSTENIITVDEVDELDPIEVLAPITKPIDTDPLEDEIISLEDLNSFDDLINEDLENSEPPHSRPK